MPVLTVMNTHETRRAGPPKAASRPCATRLPGVWDEIQAFLIAEISNSRVTLSDTSTPPVSSAAFQVMP
jgi:hypothetical protein